MPPQCSHRAHPIMPAMLLQEWAKYREETLNRSPLPCDKDLLNKVPSMEKLRKSVADIRAGDCPDAAALRASTEQFLEEKRLVQQVLALVTSAVTGFKRAKTAVEKDVETRAKKERSKAEKAAAAAAKAKAAVKKGCGPQKSSKSEWNVRKVGMHAIHGCHPVAERSGKPEEQVEFCMPWVCRASKVASDVFEGKPVKLNFLVFRTGFQKSGKASEQRVLRDAQLARTKILTLGPSAEHTIEFPAGEPREMFAECHLWAMRGGQERLTVAQNGFGALILVGSERALHQVLLAPHLATSPGYQNRDQKP